MDLTGFEIGPKLAACDERERRFVVAYVLSEDDNATDAAREAGYTDNATGAIRVTAHRVLHRERVISAIEEVGRQLFRAQLVPAIRANAALLKNSGHPDHARTVQATLSRLGLAERTAVDVNHTGEVTVNHTDAALEVLRFMRDMGVPREKQLEHFGHTGLPRYERMLAEVDARAPKVIDHRSEEKAG